MTEKRLHLLGLGGLRLCPSCGDFFKIRNRWDRRPICGAPECVADVAQRRKIYYSEWHQANKVRRAKEAHARRVANPEYEKQRHRAYYVAHKEEIGVKNKIKWHTDLNVREYHKKKTAEWRQKNKAKARAFDRAQKAKHKDWCARYQRDLQKRGRAYRAFYEDMTGERITLKTAIDDMRRIMREAA